ncbi:unnamed protein product [Protopolystoma xenopodis]|uniref:Uncharacterized protein n=1 Tax=Protopolystoma xenopodis TaxID=117903 RepID=A0A3S4ZXA8_9PLAT|nr:unnamed protein product [Protopolystoma xenopodis]
MMEFMDNKSQTKVVEVMIDSVTTVFGPTADYMPEAVLSALTAMEQVVESASEAQMVEPDIDINGALSLGYVSEASASGLEMTPNLGLARSPALIAGQASRSAGT